MRVFNRVRAAAVLIFFSPWCSSGSPKEGGKQWVGFERLRFKFGMELTPEEPRMTGQFADLDVHAVGCLACKPQAVTCKNLFKLAIELIAMAMPLANIFVP